MILGLSISRLIGGVARFVQHPGRERIYLIHIGWTLFLLLSIIHFWWFEFGLSQIKRWTFEIYFFVICYAILFYLVCSLLFPDQIDDYSGYDEYFQSRRGWFYGLLCTLFLIDMADTAIKGSAYFASLGIEYPIKQCSFAAGAILAVYAPGRRYQGAFVLICLLYQFTWILRLYDVLE